MSNHIQPSTIASGLCAGLLLISLFLTGCVSEEMSKRFSPVPQAFGKPNQVIVVADTEVWEGPIGDTFRYYFSSAFPLLPQPEPIFDLDHFTPKEMAQKPIRKELRNIVMLGDVSDEDSPTTNMIKKDIGSENIGSVERGEIITKVGRDKWAKGQLVLYIMGNSPSSLIDNTKKAFPAASRKIWQQEELGLTASTYQGGINQKLVKTLEETFNLYLKVPSDYYLAINNSETVWMRKETDFLSSNLIVHRLPYTSQSQLTKEGIKTIRDSIGRMYVRSETDNTYMRTNDVDLPMLTQTIELEDYYVLEARGIWDIVNDFMGGPYLSYLIHKPGSSELIFIDGFVHAPGKSKREYMQQLELIMRSVRLHQQP